MEKTVITVHAHPTHRPTPQPQPPSPVKLPPSISTVSKSTRSPRRTTHRITLKEVCARIRLDHNYSLPYPPEDASKSAKVKVSRFKPIKFMFGPEDEATSSPPAVQQPSSRLEHLLKRNPAFSSLPSNTHRSKSYASYRDDDDIEVDIETPPDEPVIPYDPEKALHLMNECGRHVEYSRVNDIPEDWDAHVLKTGWTKLQRILFKNVAKAFHLEHLARLAYEGNPSEPVLRRTSLDLTAQRVRQALTQICWDGKLTQWLHGVLIDNLSADYLSIYLDVLQTLRSKSPALVNRMILLSTVAASNKSKLPLASLADPESRLSQVVPDSPEGAELKKIINAKALNLLLKRPWDPFTPVIHHQQSNKPSCEPVFIIVPTGPCWGNPINPRRFKQFLNMISEIGTVESVELELQYSLCPSMTVELLAEQMIIASKAKLSETKEEYPDRPMYLIGWGPGAVVAATVSLTEKVAGVICLGFPLFGTFGRRGESGDPLLQIKHPVLFIIGGRASNNSVARMDKFRRNLNLQKDAGLIVIRCGDEYLRIGRYHKRILLVTQSYVDKCITDEIAKFVTDSYRAEPVAVEAKVPEPTQNGITHESPKTSPVKLKLKKNSEGELIEVRNESAEQTPNHNGHEFDFMDESKKIPSNVTLNKRKDYYRRPSADPLFGLHENPFGPITASKLLQKQNSTSKKKPKSAENGNSDVANISSSNGPPPLDLSVTSDANSPMSRSSQEALSQEIAQSLYNYMMSPLLAAGRGAEGAHASSSNHMDSAFFDQQFMLHSTGSQNQKSSSQRRPSNSGKPRVPRPKKPVDPNAPPKPPRSRKPKVASTTPQAAPYPKTVIEICQSLSPSLASDAPPISQQNNLRADEKSHVRQYGQSALAKLLTTDSPSQMSSPSRARDDLSEASLPGIPTTLMSAMNTYGLTKDKPDSISVPVIQSMRSLTNSEAPSKTVAQLAVEQGKNLFIALPRLNMDPDQLRAVPNRSDSGRAVTMESETPKSDTSRSDPIGPTATEFEPLKPGPSRLDAVRPTPTLAQTAKTVGPLSGEARTKLVKVVRTSDLKQYMSQGGDLTKIWSGSNLLFSAANPAEMIANPKLPISFIDPQNPALLMRPKISTIVPVSSALQLVPTSDARFSLRPSTDPVIVPAVHEPSTLQVPSVLALQPASPSLGVITEASNSSTPGFSMGTPVSLNVAELEPRSVIIKTSNESQVQATEPSVTKARISVIRQAIAPATKTQIYLETPVIESVAEFNQSPAVHKELSSGNGSVVEPIETKLSEIESIETPSAAPDSTKSKITEVELTKTKSAEAELTETKLTDAESTKPKLAISEPVQDRQSVIEKRKVSIPKNEAPVAKKSKVELSALTDNVVSGPTLRKPSLDFKPKPKKTFEEALAEIDKQAKSVTPTKKGSSVISSSRKANTSLDGSSCSGSSSGSNGQILASQKEIPASKIMVESSKEIPAKKEEILESGKEILISKKEIRASRQEILASSKKPLEPSKEILASSKKTLGSSKEVHPSKKTVESSKEIPASRRTSISQTGPVRRRKSSSPRPPVKIHNLRKESPVQPPAVKIPNSPKTKLKTVSKIQETPPPSQSKFRKCKETSSMQTDSKPKPVVKSRKTEEHVPALRKRPKIMKYVESPENSSEASTESDTSTSTSTGTAEVRVADKMSKRAKLTHLKTRLKAEPELDSSSSTDVEPEQVAKSSKAGKVGKLAKVAKLKEPDHGTLEDSDEENPRLTRSMRRQSTSARGDGEELMKKIPKPHLIRCDLDDEEDEDEDDEDESSQKKKLKPIFPVSPASLSSTRTRKVSIPKFYAYGM